MPATDEPSRDRDPRRWPAARRYRVGAEMVQWLLAESRTGAEDAVRKVRAMQEHVERLDGLVAEMEIEAAWCRDEDF